MGIRSGYGTAHSTYGALGDGSRFDQIAYPLSQVSTCENVAVQPHQAVVSCM